MSWRLQARSAPGRGIPWDRLEAPPGLRSLRTAARRLHQVCAKKV